MCDYVKFVRVSILNNAIEAQLISSILMEQDIPHQIRSYHDTAYDGLFQVQMGWGEIRSPAEFERDILEIIDAIRSDLKTG